MLKTSQNALLFPSLLILSTCCTSSCCTKFQESQAGVSVCGNASNRMGYIISGFFDAFDGRVFCEEEFKFLVR